MSPVLAAATLLEGPLGLLGLHTWNELTIGSAGVTDYPRYHLDNITGLRDRPEAEDNREANTGRPGEAVYPSEIRGKTIVYEGRIIANDPVSAAVARTALLAATASSVPGTLTIGPPAARGGVEWIAFARVLTCVCDEKLTRSDNHPHPWQYDFVLSLRMHIPTFFVLPAKTDTDAATVTVDNDGLAPSDFLVLTVEGVNGDASVENTTLGKTLVFNDLPAGDLIVNFIDRTVRVGSTDVIRYLNDIDSDWWDEATPAIEPGTNTITQTGGTSIQADWYDAMY
jgi:hypothetical protein